MPEKLKTILSIAGSDPMGGAGIQADCRCADSLGLHCLSAVTAVTVQNSSGIKSINPVPPEILSNQINAIIEDVIPDAIKIGMIGSLENAEPISEFISQLNDDIPVVVDPILAPSAGGEIINAGDSEALMACYQLKIFPFASVITPNLLEADRFLRFNGVKSSEDPKEKASLLLRLWNCSSLVLKGGHADKDSITDILTDYFDSSIVISEISHRRIDSQNVHGTGCAFSSLLASFLALGFPINEAFRKTSVRLSQIITRSCDYSLGNSSYGPLNINNYRL